MRYLLDFKNDSTSDQILNYFEENNLTIIKQFSAFEKTYLIESQTLPNANPIIEKIVEDAPGLILPLTYQALPGEALPNFNISIVDENDWWKVASVIAIDFSQDSSLYARRGNSAVVYLVDSGVKLDHTEFEFSDIENLYSMNNDFTDYNGHGTALASVISGKTCGMSSAKIKSVKIFQSNFDTLQSHLLEALDAIYTDFIQNNKKMSIVNLSWSINKNLYVEEKIRFLINAGLIVVVAAGNSGTEIQNVTPASMPDCMVVSAYDRNLEPCNFANYSSDITNSADMTNIGIVDVWAPGENIRGAGLDNNFIISAGTSMSAAIHSASLAYNADWLTLEDGSVPVTFTSSKEFLNHLSAATNNILALNTPYSSSVNKITSYVGVVDGVNGSNWSYLSSYSQIFTHGENVEKLLFTPLVYKNVVFRDPLPGNLVYNTGWILGTAINNSTTSLYFQSVIDVTYHDDTTAEIPITIGILAENTSIADLDEGDPILEISLLACNFGPIFPGSASYSCQGPCPTSTCQQCGAPGTAATQKDPGALECACGYHICN